MFSKPRESIAVGSVRPFTLNGLFINARWFQTTIHPPPPLPQIKHDNLQPFRVTRAQDVPLVPGLCEKPCSVTGNTSYPSTDLDRPRGIQEAETPRIFGQSAHEGGKVVSSGRLYLPWKITGTHLCQRLSQPQGQSAAGRVKSLKSSLVVPCKIYDGQSDIATHSSHSISVFQR
jgi:hypothetical protein